MSDIITPSRCSLTIKSGDGAHVGHIKSLTDNDITAINKAQTDIASLKTRVAAVDLDKFIVGGVVPETAEDNSVFIQLPTKTVSIPLSTIYEHSTLYSTGTNVPCTSAPASLFPTEGKFVYDIVPLSTIEFTGTLTAHAGDSNTLYIGSTIEPSYEAPMSLVSFELLNNTGFTLLRDGYDNGGKILMDGTATSWSTDISVKFKFPQITSYDSLEELVGSFRLSPLDSITITYSNANLAWIQSFWILTDPTITYVTWAD